MAAFLNAEAAPFRRRALADALDLVVVCGLMALAWRIGLVSEPLPLRGRDPLDAFAGLLAEDAILLAPLLATTPIVGALYSTCMQALLGRTLGDLVAGLRLVTTDAAPVGPLRSAAYTLLTAAGALPLLLGWLVPAVVPSRQGPAEWLTGTRRIRGLPRGPAR